MKNIITLFWQITGLFIFIVLSLCLISTIIYISLNYYSSVWQNMNIIQVIIQFFLAHINHLIIFSFILSVIFFPFVARGYVKVSKIIVLLIIVLYSICVFYLSFYLYTNVTVKWTKNNLTGNQFVLYQYLQKKRFIRIEDKYLYFNSVDYKANSLDGIILIDKDSQFSFYTRGNYILKDNSINFILFKNDGRDYSMSTEITHTNKYSRIIDVVVLEINHIAAQLYKDDSFLPSIIKWFALALFCYCFSLYSRFGQWPLINFIIMVISVRFVLYVFSHIKLFQDFINKLGVKQIPDQDQFIHLSIIAIAVIIILFNLIFLNKSKYQEFEDEE